MPRNVYYITVTECEHLVRRMLVIDPKRRYTIPQMCQHPWMTAAPDDVRRDPATVGMETVSETAVYNDHVLRVMHNLNIDEQETLKVPRLFLTFTRHKS